MATKKELFARIMDVMTEDQEVVEMCEKYIKQLSSKKVNKAAEEFAQAAATFLAEAEGPMTCSEIAIAMGVTPQKVAPAMRKLVEAEAVIAIPGEKKKDPTSYVIA